MLFSNFTLFVPPLLPVVCWFYLIISTQPLSAGPRPLTAFCPHPGILLLLLLLQLLSLYCILFYFYGRNATGCAGARWWLQNMQLG